MKLLLVGLIISMLVMAYRIFSWIRGIIVINKKPDGVSAQTLKMLNVQKWAFIIGGLEHIILFGSLLAATLILY